jgi:hypothetical protein
VSDEPVLVDRAKEVINNRILAMLDGEHAARASTAPLYVGMPVAQGEGSWLCGVTLRESMEKVEQGIPVQEVLQGALEWMLLVGMAAAQLAAAEGSQ